MDFKRIHKIVSTRYSLENIIYFGKTNRINKLKDSFDHVSVINSGRRRTKFEDLIACAVENRWGLLSLRETSITEEIVNLCHDLGVLVQASYLSESYASMVPRLVEFGVDIILGNDVREMVVSKIDKMNKK